MEAIKRIEIITNSLELKQVSKILDKAGTGDRGEVIDDERQLSSNQYLYNQYL